MIRNFHRHVKILFDSSSHTRTRTAQPRLIYAPLAQLIHSSRILSWSNPRPAPKFLRKY